jgi:hypothetical protein
LRAHEVWWQRRGIERVGGFAAKIKSERSADQPTTVSDASADENCAISFS